MGPFAQFCPYEASEQKWVKPQKLNGINKMSKSDKKWPSCAELTLWQEWQIIKSAVSYLHKTGPAAANHIMAHKTYDVPYDYIP